MSNAPKRPTIAAVRRELSELGISFRKVGDEYRVAVQPDDEPGAYYTTDLVDALETGRRMARALADDVVDRLAAEPIPSDVEPLADALARAVVAAATPILGVAFAELEAAGGPTATESRQTIAYRSNPLARALEALELELVSATGVGCVVRVRPARVETRAVLASAYRVASEGRGVHRATLTHAVEVLADGTPIRTLCATVLVASLADVDATDAAAAPTCPRCAKLDPRRGGYA